MTYIISYVVNNEKQKKNHKKSSLKKACSKPKANESNCVYMQRKKKGRQINE